MSRWALAVVMGHGFGWQIAFMHALCAVLAWCAPVFVDALGLAFAAAEAGTTGPESGGPHDARGHAETVFEKGERSEGRGSEVR